MTIAVVGANDAPVANNDTATTPEDTAVAIAVLANDTDTEGATLSVAQVSDPPHGSVVINADGTVTYTPDADYFGPDSFTYRASDGVLLSNVATVTVTVLPVNDAPVANDDTATTPEDTAVVIPVLANDTDIDSTTLSVAAVSDPPHGSVALNADGTVTYTPDADYFGPDSFTYRASDGSLLSNVATVSVTITPVNDAPVAVNDSYTTDEDTPRTVTAPGVLANDTDVDARR